MSPGPCSGWNNRKAVLRANCNPDKPPNCDVDPKVLLSHRKKTSTEDATTVVQEGLTIFQLPVEVGNAKHMELVLEAK